MVLVGELAQGDEHGLVATEPNMLIALVPMGGLFLVGGVLTLGIGLLRGPRPHEVAR